MDVRTRAARRRPSPRRCSRRRAQAGIEAGDHPGDGKQTLTSTAPASTTSTSAPWGTRLLDPHTNADTFAQQPRQRATTRRAKPLAWRNAWDIPELTKPADAAVLERDQRPGARRRTSRSRRVTAAPAPSSMIFQQTEVAAHRNDVEGLRIGPTSDVTPTCLKVGEALRRPRLSRLGPAPAAGRPACAAR
jgi:peptide/nickel transport system substrate-binding protein